METKTPGSDDHSVPIPLSPTGPLAGKTYSLYGESTTSDEYYERLEGLLDDCLKRWPDTTLLLADLAAAGKSVRRARRLAERKDSALAYLLEEGIARLGCYFSGVEAHRVSLPLKDRCSSTLTMAREQYLACAIEIALRNRLNAKQFGQSAERIAFLPHCLRDLKVECRAKRHDLDTICQACSEQCYLNAVSRLLRRHRVRPYVWMSASLSRLLRQKARAPGGFGMLGIACVPELAAGMRACARAGVPVLGLPLDANRCARWLGEFRPNTVNLGELDRLLRTCRQERI